jgi:hypothetical protein
MSNYSRSSKCKYTAQGSYVCARPRSEARRPQLAEKFGSIEHFPRGRGGGASPDWSRADTNWAARQRDDMDKFWTNWIKGLRR